MHDRDKGEHFMNIYFKDELLKYISIDDLENKKFYELLQIDCDGKKITDFIHNEKGFGIEVVEAINLPEFKEPYLHKEIWIDGVHYSLDAEEAKKIIHQNEFKNVLSDIVGDELDSSTEKVYVVKCVNSKIKNNK
jgi:hypothetical protein